MPNDRLRRAIAAAGLHPSDVARHIGIHVKTVERWMSVARLPHPDHRRRTSELLNVPEFHLWPEAADSREARSASRAELVRLYPSRSAVPGELWTELITRATGALDLLTDSGVFLLDRGSITTTRIQERAAAGATVRVLLADPESDAVSRRGAEVGVGDLLASMVRIGSQALAPLIGVPGVSVRQHRTTLYNTILRADRDMLVTSHAYGAEDRQSPVLHLRQTEYGQLYQHYLDSFERVWSGAKPLPAERARSGHASGTKLARRPKTGVKTLRAQSQESHP